MLNVLKIIFFCCVSCCLEIVKLIFLILCNNPSYISEKTIAVKVRC